MKKPLPEKPVLEKGLYEHYQGGFYWVYGLVFHTEDQIWMVHYDSVISPCEGFVRPYDMFSSMVNDQLRFRRVL